MSTLFSIDCAARKQAAVALSGVFPLGIPQRRDSLCGLFARTAESTSTAGHNRL